MTHRFFIYIALLICIPGLAGPRPDTQDRAEKPVSIKNNSSRWNAHVTYTYYDYDKGRSYRYTTIVAPDSERILTQDHNRISDVSYYMNGTGIYRYKKLTSKRHKVENDDLRTATGRLIVDIIPTTQPSACLPMEKTTHGYHIVDEKEECAPQTHSDAVSQDVWKYVNDQVTGLSETDRHTLFAYILGEKEKPNLNKAQAYALLGLKQGYITDRKLSHAALHTARQQRKAAFDEIYHTYVAPALDTVEEIEQHNGRHIASNSMARNGGYVDVLLGREEKNIKHRMRQLPDEAYQALAQQKR